MVFAHNGVDAYDRLFVNRFSRDFIAFFLTFLHPTQPLEGAIVIKIPDFGRPIRVRRLNNLRIALGTGWRIVQMKHYLGSIRPDVVIGNWVTTYGLYAWLSKWRPFILFAYGSDIVLDPNRSIFHRIITSKIVRTADLVLIDSAIQRRALLALGCSSEKIVQFPWFDPAGLRHVKGDSAIRKGMKWEDKRIAVSVRKHEPVYAIDTLIHAMPNVIAQSPDVRFLIFGKGTQTPALEKLARELHVDQFLHFAGNVSQTELLGYVKDCDIYVSTSLSDGCSSSLLEAMSLGVPAIVTAIPGNEEWISPGLNGLTFAKQNSQELSTAIIGLASNPKLGRALSQRAMVDVFAKVNWERAMNALVAKIRDVHSLYVTHEGADRPLG